MFSICDGVKYAYTTSNTSEIFSLSVSQIISSKSVLFSSFPYCIKALIFLCGSKLEIIDAFKELSSWLWYRFKQSSFSYNGIYFIIISDNPNESNLSIHFFNAVVLWSGGMLLNNPNISSKSSLYGNFSSTCIFPL